jgi:hypothetical protein
MDQMTNSRNDLLFERFTGQPPVSRKKIEKVQQLLKFRLPRSYIEFLLTKNGGEGFIGRSFLVLWKIDELVPMNVAYRVAELAPGLFLFGSDGGDEAFGFDIRSEPCVIVSVPFVGMALQLARPVASDFETFLLKLLSS